MLLYSLMRNNNVTKGKIYFRTQEVTSKLNQLPLVIFHYRGLLPCC